MIARRLRARLLCGDPCGLTQMAENRIPFHASRVARSEVEQQSRHRSRPIAS